MKSKPISGLEQEVMNIVWDRKTCTARDVVTEMAKKRELAYTTVATILQRLYDKGLVARKGNGATLLYSPKITKKVYSKTIAHEFVKKFLYSYGDTAIASFAQSIDKLPKEKREYFLKLLEENDTNK